MSASHPPAEEPKLAGLLEQARALSLDLCRYKLGGGILDSEVATIENAERSAVQLVHELKQLTKARRERAEIGS